MLDRTGPIYYLKIGVYNQAAMDDGWVPVGARIAGAEILKFEI